MSMRSLSLSLALPSLRRFPSSLCSIPQQHQFDAPYAAICGITKQEVTENFMPEIEAMGENNGWTVDETVEQLKANYDGYHFSRNNMVDVYNPFSLINALADREIRNYWASSGATSLLLKFVDDLRFVCKISTIAPCWVEWQKHLM